MPDTKKLNTEQEKGVRHTDGPLLIIAGAGTGKTTVVTERIKHLILSKNIPPANILALTFTEKAAREMEERIDEVMPYGYTQMWIATFHSFCDRILRLEAIHIGLSSSYKLLTEAESIAFLRKHLFEFNLEYFRPLGNPNKFLEGLLGHFNRLRDEDINPEQYLRYAQKKSKVIRSASSGQKSKKNQLDARRYDLSADPDEIKKTLELTNAYKVYSELKAKENVMDFGDLIANTLLLFRTRKNILKNYQLQFEYVLVDEFQDTNYAQNQLAILLAGEKENITVVGDDDQAIYRWRGAAISNMIQFRKHFPSAKLVTLTKNYRSSVTILKESYKLIQNNNPDRLEAKENIKKELSSERNKKGEPVSLLFAHRVEDEAEKAAKKIVELTKERYTYKDIAILVRANDHAASFVRAFERHKIPFQFLGPGRLFHQEEIKDLIAYLKILYNFEDSTSIYRVLSMKVFGLESIEIAALLNLARKRNYTLFETLENIDETFLQEATKEKVKEILVMIKRHIEKIKKDTAGQILYYFLQDSGFLKTVLSPKNQLEEKQAKNIAKFFDKLKTFEIDNDDASVYAVVDWIDLSMQLGESPLATDTDWAQNNAVNILTIHSSKGLEFPVVFLVNLVTQRFPTRERKEQIPIPEKLIKEILPEGDFHLQEERRLFYVGMTRAKDLLFLTAANYYGEGKRERKLSPFVYETLGEKVVEKIVKDKNQEKPKHQLSLFEWQPKQEEILTGISRVAPVTYLSYSQLQTFDICPLHYKLRYLLKIPTQQSAAQSFGTSIHTTLRDFYKPSVDGQDLNLNLLEEILERNWINEGYSSKKHEENAKTQARKVIEKYLTDNVTDKKTLPKILGLEIPFQFSLRNALTNEWLKIAGRIDRVDALPENKIEIIDYKTGRNVPDEKSLTKDIQLTVYALAAASVHDVIFNRKPEEILLSLYYLEESKKLTTTRTMEELEQAKTYLLQKAKEIAESDYACSKSNFCLNCEYKILCSNIS